MGDHGGAQGEHAHGGVRPRRAAGRRGDDHARHLPVTTRVVLYSGRNCHLCEQARAVLNAEGVAYDEVDITGDPALEAAHREWLPVVEIDGRRAFVYRIPVDALRRKLMAQG